VVLRFEVEDTGPGIAQEELPAIFDAFVQSETGRRAQEGTGLGLTISQEFVSLMGGDLAVDSQIGQGSRFGFDVLVEVTPSSGATSPGRRHRRVVGLEPGQGGPWRTLVVDEREASRKLLVRLLAPLGFEVREAANGQEAIEVWQDWQPDLVLMDMRMPVMDGYEATKRIKAAAQGQSTVVVAVTASAFEDDRERILCAGCDDVLRKPFREEDLYDVVARHLGTRFVYEEIEPLPATSHGHPITHEGGADLAQRLAALPAAWVTDLEEAATLGDLVVLRELIAVISGHDAELGEVLAALAGQFEHDGILALIEQAGEME
jgi:two-component system sensor histidine kinase/response regulator